jgi:hypothetical protein
MRIESRAEARKSLENRAFCGFSRGVQMAEIGGKLRQLACVESAGANDWRKWLAAWELSGGGIGAGGT